MAQTSGAFAYSVRACAALAGLIFLPSSPVLAAGSVVLDGSYGTSGALPGPNYTITAGMGRQMGPNLFQSFSQFNLVNGETATFTPTGSTGAINNILARVTGGSPSSIDGTINSTIPGANLFFLNPSGVMFGAHAQVNVGGAFAVSTADYVKFSDGGIFYARVGASDVLSSAPVSAFGFLSSSPAAISATGSQITMANGTGLHVIGGDITLNGATLLAPAGTLTLFSAAGSGEVPFSLASPGAGFGSATVSGLGSITLQNLSQAGIDGNGGGAVVIRGGRLTVDNSGITSVNSGAVAGGNISVQSGQVTVSNGGFIGSDSFGSAQAGSVNVGVSGNLSVSGSGSQISADTEASGLGGVIDVTAGGSIDLNGGDILANTDGAGNAGTVTVSAQSLSMEGTGRLSTVTAGGGNAGTVNLTLNGPLTMADTSGIVADTYTSGAGGNINLTSGPISMSGRLLISANTYFSTGNGGNISIRSSSLSIAGTGAEPPGSLGITAQSFTPGNAGAITVSTGPLTLSGGGVISTASQGAGRGGNISLAFSQGWIYGPSVISASSEFTSAGSINISAGALSLYGNASVTTSAGDNGGDITLQLGQLLYLDNSNIQAFAGVASFPGQVVGGNGGNIDIDPEFVVLGDSFISANDLSPLGHDGNIINTANFFFTNDSVLHATGTIETPAPDLDLAGSLLVLPGNLVDVQNRLRETCAQSVSHEFSTLIVVGRDGTETGPNELQADFGLTLPSGSSNGR